MAVRRVGDAAQGVNALVNKRIEELYGELVVLLGDVRDIPPCLETTLRLLMGENRHQDIMPFNIDEDRLLRLNEVLRYVPVGKSTWWEGVRTGRYPAPVRLGSRVTAWRLSSIMQLVKGEVANHE